MNMLEYIMFNIIYATICTCNLYKIITGQVSSLGDPNVVNILVNWSKSDSPGKKGTLSKSSAIIQPTAQISTLGPYDRAPNKSSGAR